MIPRRRSLLAGNGMKTRAIRGTALSVMGFSGSQVVRLGSNQTYLLFSEHFQFSKPSFYELRGPQRSISDSDPALKLAQFALQST